MPVSRATAERLAKSVADAYAKAERVLLERIARNLAKGIKGPAWAEQKRAQLAVYHAETRRLIADLQAQAKTGVRTALTEAYRLGGMEAVRDIGAAAIAAEPLGGLRAVELLARELDGKLAATGLRILRASDDVYREAVAAGAEQVLLGAQTRIQATQGVLDRFARNGVTGFTDKAGRAWSLTSYAEMAVRSGTMNAAVAGHVGTLQANGLDLVIVSDDGEACPACADWEGQVLSSSGTNSDYPSLDDAIADGLMHPSCRHTVSLYQEGVTRDYPTKDAETQAEQAQRYQANQKLRYIERQIRESKRMQAVAIDPAAQAKASARVARYQKQAREHVSSTSAVRQYPREAFGKAH